MKHDHNQGKPTSPVAPDQRTTYSALWAAAGDALGWITELSGGEKGVRRRIGSNRVKEPVAWKRIIGGRGGPQVNLPAGTYSDDTQLRLAVSRSIRGDGIFDVETFAKIELTVWPSYSLGGGRGTKAAAANLSRRGVNWFSNFFETGEQNYIKAGGNGAAMRIQPHVWASSNPAKMLRDVLVDSLVTHGHPQGFCGALFHALCLADTFKEGQIPSPQRWIAFAEVFTAIPEIVRKDSQLTAFWLPAWEQSAGTSLEEAVEVFLKEALLDIRSVSDLINAEGNIRSILSNLGCLSERYRGAGFKTALAASGIAYLCRSSPIEDVLVLIANELESDTDTIASMAGAILGVNATYPPTWAIQDVDYIAAEAMRLSSLAKGEHGVSFIYPDLGRWSPPSSQSDAIGSFENGLAIAGLGKLAPQGGEYEAGDAFWQWFDLPFGQTILGKRRRNPNIFDRSQLPLLRRQPAKETSQDNLLASASINQSAERKRILETENKQHAIEQKKLFPEDVRDPLDAATDEAIHSGFDNHTMGRLLNQLIDSTDSVTNAVAFAAIVAKAKLARKRRR